MTEIWQGGDEGGAAGPGLATLGFRLTCADKRDFADIRLKKAEIRAWANRYSGNLVSQGDLVRGMLDEVVCDVDIGRLVALRPKPAFAVLLRQVSGLQETSGLFQIVST